VQRLPVTCSAHASNTQTFDLIPYCTWLPPRFRTFFGTVNLFKLFNTVAQHKNWDLQYLQKVALNVITFSVRFANAKNTVNTLSTKTENENKPERKLNE